MNATSVNFGNQTPATVAPPMGSASLQAAAAMDPKKAAAATMGASSSQVSITTLPERLVDFLSSGHGPLTAEGLMAMLYEMMDTQTQMIQAKVTEFKNNTRIQAKYAKVRETMAEAQALASEHDQRFLTVDQVRQLGLSDGDIALLTDSDFGVGDSNGQIDPAELMTALNHKHFGTNNTAYHVSIRADSGGGVTFKSDHGDFAANVFDRIDSKRDQMSMDTTLLTQDLQVLVQKSQQMPQMFSNILSKMYETNMGVIRNI